jgi:hypothetical protein
MLGERNGATGSGIVASLRFKVVSENPGTLYLNHIEVIDRNLGYNVFSNYELAVQVVPQKTTLLQNYPNPFNPETWIPYQLANNSTVVIKIYNFSGQLIRTLELGNNRAGYYTTPSQAAYWNGQNESGEFVSSGVYFYIIQGDNFVATRKMVLLK